MKTDLNQTCHGIAQSVDTDLPASQKMAVEWEGPHRLEREAGERPPSEHSPGEWQCCAFHNGSLKLNSYVTIYSLSYPEPGRI